jgi:hypothetical protein
MILRKQRINIPLTEFEYEQIRKESAKENIPGLSAFCRKVVLDYIAAKKAESGKNHYGSNFSAGVR